ncbi:hypothetical protein HPB50_009104 [Hyalomma asiaticum]|uniref:Uncharacterized protein n=1 Tax=Hyalomma asiaticum TaxID=266040 RepID=A0ACB7T1R6_HYAAI|nr:hypothetical protein HPB50_009104 [Hyalomma asiaticum]
MSQELPFQEWTNSGAPTATDSAFRRDGPAPNKSEAAKLLEMSTESESEPEPLQLVPPKRKVRFRKRLRGARGLVLTGGPHSSSSCCGGGSEGCLSLAKVLGILLGVAILVAQAWFLLSVRSRLDHLYTIYRQNSFLPMAYSPNTRRNRRLLLPNTRVFGRLASSARTWNRVRAPRLTAAARRRLLLLYIPPQWRRLGIDRWRFGPPVSICWRRCRRVPRRAYSRCLRGAAKLACRPDACSGPPFKKMKKRKELDALVSCRATAPRAVLSSSQQQQHAVQELLRKGAVVAAAGSHGGGGGHGSDSSDVETSSYAALAAYRLPASPPVRWWAWLPVGLVLLVGAAGALVWLHLTLRQDLDSLRAHLHRVDVDGKKLPAQLHDLHAQIKGLEQNLSSTATELHRTAADLVALAKQVADLKATTGSLQESVASAPQIKGLPSAVTDLKQNVANLGSQVSSLENGLQALKEQHNSLQVLRKDIDQVKEQVQRISNASAVAVDDQSSTHTSLHDLEQSVQQCLGEVRTVVDQRLVGLESGLKEVHTTTENHTDILLRQQTQLEGVLNCTHTCPADLSPENLSLALDRLLSPNATINGSAVVDVLKEAGHLGTVYHGLQAHLGVNHSATDEVAELLQRATLYAQSPPPHPSPQMGTLASKQFQQHQPALQPILRSLSFHEAEEPPAHIYAYRSRLHVLSL